LGVLLTVQKSRHKAPRLKPSDRHGQQAVKALMQTVGAACTGNRVSHPRRYDRALCESFCSAPAAVNTLLPRLFPPIHR
jgi:hypothetical protein